MQNPLSVCYAIVHDCGEDSHAICQDEQGLCLCVTDGCGGLGSKRYEALEGRTGAYIAARLAAQTFADWAEECRPAPKTINEAEKLCREIEQLLFQTLRDFADEHLRQEKSRIMGSMQKTLPTTLCAFTAYQNELCFWWAGDSRGYVLDENGLSQYTRDHLRAETDAFETLYRDAPLSNLLCADHLGKIECRRLKQEKPAAVMVATDGVYSALPSPMETEMLLLDTLRNAASYERWGKRLHRKVRRNAQDDASLLIIPLNADHFEQLKQTLLPRREVLQKHFITPLRRHRGDAAYAREKWLAYKPAYDRTEENNE